jgi:hypothetical protein
VTLLERRTDGESLAEREIGADRLHVRGQLPPSANRLINAMRLATVVL